jgi:methionyl-tRNA formyltransferase
VVDGKELRDTTMNLVFAGTPRFAVPTLGRLVDAGFRVPLVITQPDKPRGRGMEIAFSPVKQAAESFNIPVIQPDKIKTNDELRAQLASLGPDAIIVVGYGRIIPQWMLDLPRFGNLNLHASLLPKYRGAAPIQWAIALGERVTGVTTMRINAGLDTGDILLQREMTIAPGDTSETLAPRLSAIGADLMVETLHGLSAGTIAARPQEDSLATLAPILKKEDGAIDFRRPAGEIVNRLRGFQPWPGAFTTFRGKALSVRSARASGTSGQAAPGSIESAADRLLVQCGGGASIEILELQPEGKKRMAARDFIHGYKPKSGERLGE